MARKSKGRQKIEMVKMSNESSLRVTFSKRRSGLFKKASELCILCGVEVAIIVFSPSNKVYSFGHPCVASMMDRFITRNPPQISDVPLTQAYRNAIIYELNTQLTLMENELEIEKKRGEELTQIIKASQSERWCQAPIDELSPLQLANLKEALEELKKQVIQQAQKVMMESSGAPQYFPGSSSTGGILQFDPTNTNSNLSNENIMPPLPPLPMIQSSAHPQDFSNNIGFNPPNVSMVPPPHMIQSSASSQYFPGNSSTGEINPLDPNNIAFNPLNTDMMPPPPYY